MILVMGPEQLASRVEWLHRFNEDHVKNAVLHWIFAGLSGRAFDAVRHFYFNLI